MKSAPVHAFLVLTHWQSHGEHWGSHPYAPSLVKPTTPFSFYTCQTKWPSPQRETAAFSPPCWTDMEATSIPTHFDKWKNALGCCHFFKRIVKCCWYRTLLNTGRSWTTQFGFVLKYFICTSLITVELQKYVYVIKFSIIQIVSHFNTCQIQSIFLQNV